MADTACPICRKPVRAETKPFCSRRCADIDLGRWFSGSYAIPGPPADLEDEDGTGRPADGHAPPVGGPGRH